MFSLRVLKSFDLNQRRNRAALQFCFFYILEEEISIMSETMHSVSRRKVLTLVATAFGTATMPLVFMASDAEAQTAGMERRQERRTGRHERRETRRTGRHERRETRRGGGSATTGTASTGSK
jgi:hypothetical protein